VLVCGVRHLVSYVRAEINRPRAPIFNFQISPPLWSEKKIKPIKYHGAKKGGYAKRTAGLPGIAAVCQLVGQKRAAMAETKGNDASRNNVVVKVRVTRLFLKCS